MIEEQGEEIAVSPAGKLLQSLRRKEVDPTFAKTLQEFIRSSPHKKQIEEVSNAIKKSRYDALHYHDVTDLLIIVIKLLFSLAKEEDPRRNEVKFNEKFQLLQEKLKKDDVSRWIKGLKEAISRSVLQKIEENERRKARDAEEWEVLTAQIKSLKAERDKAVDNFKGIALAFFSYSQVEGSLGKPEFYQSVLKKIETQNSELSAKQEKAKREEATNTRLLQLCRKHGVKGEGESLVMVEAIDKHLLELQVKLKVQREMWEQMQASGSEREDSIAKLMFKLQKSEEAVKYYKAKAERLPANQVLTQ